jgi:hypothetical protein
VWELPPVSPQRARAMLRRLRIWPILDGARGREPADVDALVDLVVAFGAALADGAGTELAGVDLNPVVVGPKGRGAVAVDASVLVRDDSTTMPDPDPTAEVSR